MSRNTSSYLPTFIQGESLSVLVSFDEVLADGATITGTPTAAEQTTSDLTITNVAATTAEQKIHGRRIDTGRALQFRVTGQQSGTTYTVKLTVATSNSDTFIRYIKFIGATS